MAAVPTPLKHFACLPPFFNYLLTKEKTLSIMSKIICVGVCVVCFVFVCVCVYFYLSLFLCVCISYFLCVRWWPIAFYGRKRWIASQKGNRFTSLTLTAYPFPPALYYFLDLVMLTSSGLSSSILQLPFHHFIIIDLIIIH